MPATKFNSFQEIIAAHKGGEPVGIYSICSSNPFVLKAAIRHALKTNRLLLVESTSNQVNQFGGYTGMVPKQFQAYLHNMAANIGYSRGRLLLGGDHLGPNAWQQEPAGIAMQKASDLVADAIRAGYTKIHLDASMRLADDPPGSLPPEIAVQRATILLKSAENAWHELPPDAPRPLYVIGSEVPSPGGAVGPEQELQITSVANARQFIEISKQSVCELGLEAAWERVIALVVQPGVEFGDDSIHPYHQRKAARLSNYIETVPGMVFEAHSTDYQTAQALRQLVIDHFAVLKVGPALTFALREALFALELIEHELENTWGFAEISNLSAVVEEVMSSEPKHWQKYYSGTDHEKRYKRRFSKSDRIRYYWQHPRIIRAVDQLLKNLGHKPIPQSLISQYFPCQLQRMTAGEIGSSAVELILDKICDVIRDYEFACGC